MSTLYERLAAKVAEFTDDPPRCAGDRPWFCGGDDYELAVAAVRAVVELHKPEPTHPGPLSTLVCHGCELDGYDAEHPPWPCWTITAIAEALGIGETPK